jgi:hypothetical protein
MYKKLIIRWLIVSIIFLIGNVISLSTGWYGFYVDVPVPLDVVICNDPWGIFLWPFIAGAIFTLIFLRKSGLIDND